MWNGDVVVGIEGKADGSLGSQLIGDAIVNASGNKMHRICGMIKMLFGDAPENHKAIRYQLVTATAATLLEAKERNVKNAVLLVLVFKKDGFYSEQKIAANNADIDSFLNEICRLFSLDYLLARNFISENLTFKPLFAIIIS